LPSTEKETARWKTEITTAFKEVEALSETLWYVDIIARTGLPQKNKPTTIIKDVHTGKSDPR